MAKGSIKILAVVSALALSTMMCSIFAPSTADAPRQTQQADGTIVALQATIDSMQAGAQATASAWMTEVPAGQPGSSGTPQTPTDFPNSGSIVGKLSYPSSFIPPLRIVAFNTGTGEYFVVEQNQGAEYQIENVPAGKYQVVAYLIDPSLSEVKSAGYTQAVPCGLSVDCKDHSLITFEVKPDETANNINPGDWYAPAGSFPPDPTAK